MGYDFHLTPAGPRLIEINTNAGGALLNGLHTAAACDPEKLALRLRRAAAGREHGAADPRHLHRGAGAGAPGSPPRVASPSPTSGRRRSPCAPSSSCSVALFERAGVRAAVCDPGELERAPGGLALRGETLDLVYLRDTDWGLEAPRSRALRAAYLAGEGVLTPSPREHHLLANKERLALFSSAEALAALGAGAEDAALLAEVVPETRTLEALGARGGLAQSARVGVQAGGGLREPRGLPRRQDLAPEAGGDRRCRRLRGPAARRSRAASPWRRPRGPRRMKFDVRAYAYRTRCCCSARGPTRGRSRTCALRAAASRRSAWCARARPRPGPAASHLGSEGPKPDCRAGGRAPQAK